MKKIFCFIIVCLYVLLCPICAVAKDTGICSTGNELFYHSVVGEGLKMGLPVEAFSRLSTQTDMEGNVFHTFRYPDRDAIDTVTVTLGANADGYTRTVVIGYRLNKGEAPNTANIMITICKKICFITDIEFAAIFEKMYNQQFDYYENSPLGYTMGSVSFYSSRNKKTLDALIASKDSYSFFMISSPLKNP